MHKYLGSCRGVPILSCLVAFIIYGPALIIVATDPSDRGKQIATCVVIWVFSFLFVIIIFRWVYHVLNGAVTSSPLALWGLFDVVLASYHVLAALGFSLWLMDSSPLKDSYFTGIATLNDPYSVYVGDFLLYVISLFNSSGFTALLPRPSTPLVAIYSIAVSLCGLLFIGLLINIILLRSMPPPTTTLSHSSSKTPPAFVSEFNMPRQSFSTTTAGRVRPSIYKQK